MVEIILGTGLIIGFLVVLFWVSFAVSRPTKPEHMDIMQLLHHAGVVCPFCGRPPESVSRTGTDTFVSVTCGMLHRWTVTDSNFMLPLLNARGEDAGGT